MLGKTSELNKEVMEITGFYQQVIKWCLKKFQQTGHLELANELVEMLEEHAKQ